MKAPKAKIELAVRQPENWDSGTDAKAAVYLDTTGKRLVATNCWMLASIPSGELAQTDTGGLIPAEAFKAARKGRGRADIQANGTVRVEHLGATGAVEGGVEEFPRPDGRFPNVEPIIAAGKPADGTPATICLDAELLHRLAQSIGAKRAVGNPKGLVVRLYVSSDKAKPIYVDSPDCEGFGLLMPTRA